MDGYNKIMRIEEIDKTKLSKAPDKELLILHLRFIQLWNKNFKSNDKVIVGSLNRGEFLAKYRLLIKEYSERKLEHSTEDIDRAAFKKAMEVVKLGIDTADLGDIVVVPDYISIGGSFVKTPKEAEDVDIILRENEESRDESLELKLSRIIQKQVQKNCHFIYASKGPHGSHIPLFDLVLRAKENTKKIEVKEDYQKSVDEYYQNLDKWNDGFEADYKELAKHLVGDTVLSLGCGTGRLEKRLSSIYKMEGVDNNDIALEMCRDKKLKVKKIDLEKEKLPYEDDSFDNVIGIHILEHLQNPVEVVKEARRVASRRVVFICPLGKREDPTHKQEFNNQLDFRKKICEGLKLPDKKIKLKKVDEGDNTIILILKAEKFTKGGEGSGDFGHAGCPGEVGGSGTGRDGGSTESIRNIPTKGSGISLTDDELNMLHDYTVSSPDALTYKNEKNLSEEEKKYNAKFEGALLKLPATPGVCYRGMDFENKDNFQSFLKQTVPGTIYAARGIQAATNDLETAVTYTGSDNSVLLKIKGSTCRDISDYSILTSEGIKEFAFLKGTTYRVTTRGRDKSSNLPLIEMEELT